MYIINTSFHAERTIAKTIVAEIQSLLIPAMSKSGHFSDIIIAEILVSVDPNCYSFTLQGLTTDFEKAMEWIQGEGQIFFNELHKRYGENVVYFTTPMRMLK